MLAPMRCGTAVESERYEAQDIGKSNTVINEEAIMLENVQSQNFDSGQEEVRVQSFDISVQADREINVQLALHGNDSPASRIEIDNTPDNARWTSCTEPK
ncbi:hypothetical protein V6N13_106241 [Hibiscus sabdariffa]|uniref:Uncharacterized protein n=1 Tax=Hibiscus sabdariffa TaxID=183260 RepID=A0ABR2F041_9ROSI